MHTPLSEQREREIMAALWDVLVQLENKIRTSSDNKGMQYKINTQANWKGTIGIRCNYVYLGAITSYVDCINSRIAANQVLSLLEYISIARAHETEPTTSRKRSVPWQKTMFITFRLPRKTHDRLREALPEAVENYMELGTLLEALQKLQERTDG